MVRIDGKTAVSICGLGENSAYQYALVVRPGALDSGTSVSYYYDRYGHAVFFDNLEFGRDYVRKEGLVLVKYTLLKALYGYVEGDTGWTETEDTPFSEAIEGIEAKIA